jgi:hypothetical protein
MVCVCMRALFNDALSYWDYVAPVVAELKGMEERRNENGRGKPKYILLKKKNLSHCHFVRQKFHVEWPEINSGLRVERPAQPVCVYVCVCVCLYRFKFLRNDQGRYLGVGTGSFLGPKCSYSPIT